MFTVYSFVHSSLKTTPVVDTGVAQIKIQKVIFLFVRRQYQSGVFVIVFVIAAAEGGVCTTGAPDAAGAEVGDAAVLLLAVVGADVVLAADVPVEAAGICNFWPTLMRSVVMLLAFFSSATVILYFLAITVRLSPATTV